MSEIELSRGRMFAVAAAVLVLSFSCLLFYFRENSHLAGNDTIYYMAIADSVVAGGEPLDLTSDPPQRVRTPQNGIVVFYVALKKLGFGTEGTWTALALLNYLLHLLSVWPLYRILRRTGLSGAPLVALLAFYAGSWHILRSQLLPVNDAIFNTCSLWLIDFLLEIGEGAEGGRRRFLQIMTLIFSVLLVHFRLQTFLIIGPALLVFLVLRRWKSAAWTGGLIAAALVSLAITYTVIDRGAIEGRSTHYLAKAGISDGGFIQKQISKAYMWSTQAIPDLLFADGGLPMNMLYASFGVAFVLALWPAWKRREEDPTSLLLALICLIGTIFAVVMLRSRSRYLLYVLPFFYLFMLRVSWLRSIAYLFIIASLTVSLVRPIIPIPRSYQADFWLHLIDRDPIELGEDPLLYSQQHRNPYYFLGVAESTSELTLDLLVERGGSVYYVGDRNFLDRGEVAVRALAAEAGYDVERTRRTQGYWNKHGYALDEMKLIGSKDDDEP